MKSLSSKLALFAGALALMSGCAKEMGDGRVAPDQAAGLVVPAPLPMTA